MKKLFSLLLIMLLVFTSCTDKEDEPKTDKDKLVGYWAITHIKTIEHIGGSHSTSDKEVPPHGVDSYVTDENYRYDILIFDEEFVTVRGDMPSRPRQKDYEDTPNGMCEYMNDLENWFYGIGEMTDQFECPVGTYDIKGENLILGSLKMGRISFESDNEFTLDYNKSLNNAGDYRRSIYTYTRIYSLLL